MEKYIHPTDEKITSFIKDLGLEGKNLEEITDILFKWFDTFVTYSRLDAPFFPLQNTFGMKNNGEKSVQKELSQKSIRQDIMKI